MNTLKFLEKINNEFDVSVLAKGQVKLSYILRELKIL